MNYFSCYIYGSVKVPQSNKIQTQQDLDIQILDIQIYEHMHGVPWWPYKKWWQIVNIINVIIYVAHELLYGENVMKWTINVKITCSSKNSIFFLTPCIKGNLC